MKYRRIRDLREDSDLSQAQLGEILHVSQNTYCKYELGKIALRDDILLKLADFYGISVDYLLDRTDDPTPP
ncbi:helix-turn-helix transcriptional regulator [Clostridiaceae bacterium NSJ-31]|uniref:Helix-turn-helix transcriptional regulator n=1 Tax=Ligaoa zhengdingensis TaxID=2763658 RepID=A0A926I3Y7_9FIRM|nr:helix-turn-helix transcriptional regulator [Ligaoa zhengdingensis]MBC8546829.1 helix-turn-helix transcriptional regulator [Ligaoa zhengdingensis]